MTRLLVTGATGFFGGHLARHAAAEFEVVATGRNVDRLVELEARGVACVAGDLTTSEAVDELAATNPDVIVHAAARSSPWGDLAAFTTANVVATERVLSIAGRCDAPVVYISTPAVYMDGTDRVGIDENAALPDVFVNDYVTTKRVGELLVLDDALARGVPAAILRPQAIVGAGDTTIAPRFLRVAERGLFPLVDAGRAQLDLTHVGNAVEATFAAADAVNREVWTATEIFNITNGEPAPVRDLVERFLAARSRHSPGARKVRFLPVPARPMQLLATAAETGARRLDRSEPPLTHYSLALLGTSRTLDITKARRLLAYDPSAHPIDSAFDQFFAVRPTP